MDDYWRLCKESLLPLTFAQKEEIAVLSFPRTIARSRDYNTNLWLRLAGTTSDPLFHVVGCGLLS